MGRKQGGPAKPNHALHLTASSVRSRLAAAPSCGRGHRASTRRLAARRVATPAAFVGQSVAHPCALGIAAALHHHTVALPAQT